MEYGLAPWIESSKLNRGGVDLVRCFFGRVGLVVLGMLDAKTIYYISLANTSISRTRKTISCVLTNSISKRAIAKDPISRLPYEHDAAI